MATRRSASGYGNVRSRSALTELKTAVLAPMPSARVRTAVRVNPGERASRRRPKRRSWMKDSRLGKPQLSRLCSRRLRALPKRRSARVRASSGRLPWAMRSAVSSSTCCCISASSWASSRVRCARKRSLRSRFISAPHQLAAMASRCESGGIKGSCGFKHAKDCGNGLVEAGHLCAELFAARSRELVVAGAAVVFRGAPLGLDPSVKQQPLERGIERAFFNLQHFMRNLLDALGDAVAVHAAQAQRLEDEHVEGAGKHFIARVMTGSGANHS